MRYRYRNFSELEETIFRSAKKLFVQHGYSAITQDMISQDSGANKSAIIWHFHGKEKLLEHFVHELLEFRENLLERIREDVDDNILSVVTELVTFHRLCNSNAIAKELFTVAYNSISMLSAVREEFAYLKQHYWKNIIPELDAEAYEHKEIIASNLELALLRFSETPEYAFEDRITLVLDTYLELYLADEEHRQTLITKALEYDYVQEAQTMFAALADE